MSTVAAEARRPGGQPTTAESFWARVDRTGECWLWTGRADDKGYGRVGYQRRQNVGAHRVAWALTHDGELPDGWVLHRCDNPPCVRPSHLFLGDAPDNNRDRQDKGRTRGWAGRVETEHHAFRISTDLTAAMQRLRGAGATQQAIADEFSVSRGHVSKILRGLTVAARKAV